MVFLIEKISKCNEANWAETQNNFWTNLIEARMLFRSNSVAAKNNFWANLIEAKM